MYSPGRSLIEGPGHRQFIREGEFDAEVGIIVARPNFLTGYDMPGEAPGVCASACMLAFIDGVKRDKGIC